MGRFVLIPATKSRHTQKRGLRPFFCALIAWSNRAIEYTNPVLTIDMVSGAQVAYRRVRQPLAMTVSNR
jgi:hypothetical protein